MITRAQFINNILPITLKWESGYNNDPEDKGKETYRGITRRDHPDWEGWAILDKYKPLRRGDIINDSALKEAVQNLYHQKYFILRHFDKLDFSIVAIQCFDFAVLGGYSVKRLQALLNDRYGLKLSVDGVMGDKTLAAINKQNPQEMALNIIQLRSAYHKELEEGEENDKFENGWKRRIKFFTEIIKVIQ
jgi:lysozyme family protein